MKPEVAEQVSAIFEEAKFKALSLLASTPTPVPVLPVELKPEQLIDAHEVARLLRYEGKRPEQAVYELVRRGHLPKGVVVWVTPKRMMFHPTKLAEWQANGGCAETENSE